MLPNLQSIPKASKLESIVYTVYLFFFACRGLAATIGLDSTDGNLGQQYFSSFIGYTLQPLVNSMGRIQRTPWLEYYATIEEIIFKQNSDICRRR